MIPNFDFFDNLWGISLCYFYCVSPYSVRMRENANQNNSEYGHFLRRVLLCFDTRSDKELGINFLDNAQVSWLKNYHPFHKHPI